MDSGNRGSKTSRNLSHRSLPAGVRGSICVSKGAPLLAMPLDLKKRKLSRNRYNKSKKGKASVKNYKEAHRKSWRKQHKAAKGAALTHYGKGGKLLCQWPWCKVSDLDMLTLDHIKDDGAKHRKDLGCYGGKIYEWLRAHGFPPELELQTLCWNHQWKKRIGGLHATAWKQVSWPRRVPHVRE